MHETTLTNREQEIALLAEAYVNNANLPYFRRQIRRWQLNRSHPALAPAFAAKPRLPGVVAREWPKPRKRKS